MFGKAQDEDFKAEIKATLAALTEKIDSLATSLAALGERVVALEDPDNARNRNEENRERQRLWMRIERIERQMQADGEQARSLAQAWIDQRSALDGNTN